MDIADFCSNIKVVDDYVVGSKIDIPRSPGVYAFWWIGKRTMLKQSNREIILFGPGKSDVNIKYRNVWHKGLKYPCLYIGKTTNLRKRFGQHLMRGSNNRLHNIPSNNHKVQPRTSTCQLRYGIEHIFREEDKPLELILKNVGYSYKKYEQKDIAERFFHEVMLIGKYRPWFNVDSER